MNRLWHETVAAAAGVACMCAAEAAEVQLASVRRYQRKQRSRSPQGRWRGQLNVSQSFFLYSLLSSSPLWVLFIGNPPSLSLHLAHFPCTAPSPSLFSGEPAVPCRPVCASAEMTSILSAAGCVVLLLTVSAMCATLRAPLSRRILKSEAAFGRRARRGESCGGMIEIAASVPPVHV